MVSFFQKSYIFCLLLLYSHAFQNCPALRQGDLAFIPHIYQLLAEDCPQGLGVTPCEEPLGLRSVPGAAGLN